MTDDARRSDRRNLPAKRSDQAVRPIGVRIGTNIYAPALPLNASDARVLASVIDAHSHVVAAFDRYHRLAEAHQLPRVALWDPVADEEAQQDELNQQQHQRELAKKRRDRELLEAELETLKAKHHLEAEMEFKDRKFELGAARFSEKAAKHRVEEARFRVGEADARAAMKEEILEPEAQQRERSASQSAMDVLAGLVDEVDRQIQEAEAAGKPTEKLREKLAMLQSTLLEEVLKARR